MPNAKDLTQANGSIMVIGDSGTHKTWFLGTLPKCFVFDFDAGMATVRGKDIDYETFKDAGKGTRVSAEDGKKFGIYPLGDGWLRFMERLQGMGDKARAGTLPYNFIGFDSLSFMTLLSRNRALIEQGAAKPHQGVYGDENHFITVVFNEIVTWPVRIVATAHIMRDKNELTQNNEKLPALTGKLAARLPSYFDEVYYVDFTGEGANRKYTIKSEPTPEFRQARTRWNVPNGTELHWDKLKPFLANAGPALK